ncbi:UNVERIFIED_CONTAM: hypothetical protein GTU68_036257 [Idotea baltica]|nr:hypothetical protein [Idotea baltica]
MEGLADSIVRDILTSIGGIDWCVSEFIRVSDQLLTEDVYRRKTPELFSQAKTPSGTPLHIQLLGSDPSCLADNASFACKLGAPAIDLNFGCPAKTVNKSRGGAVLLQEPDLLYDIVREVRKTIPADIPVTAKMRLGYTHKLCAVECAQALAEGGAQHIVVHARTKLENYKPPAHWEWIAKINEAVSIPIIANGDIWTLDDWYRCREVSGVDDVMIGRGLLWQPDLARQIAQARAGQTLVPMPWTEFYKLLVRFWQQTKDKMPARYAPGRLKQWLNLLANHYPQAKSLFERIRKETDYSVVDNYLYEHHHAEKLRSKNTKHS